MIELKLQTCKSKQQITGIGISSVSHSCISQQIVRSNRLQLTWQLARSLINTQLFWTATTPVNSSKHYACEHNQLLNHDASIPHIIYSPCDWIVFATCIKMIAQWASHWLRIQVALPHCTCCIACFACPIQWLIEWILSNAMLLWAALPLQHIMACACFWHGRAGAIRAIEAFMSISESLTCELLVKSCNDMVTYPIHSQTGSHSLT